MKRYSIAALAWNAALGHRRWPRAWRDPAPRPSYQMIIVGGGGHGLATAFHLARDHGIRDVAVLEKGWIGGGNTGRNTAIIRSDYLLQPNSRFYEFSLKLWERLSETLNFNVMFSPRGTLYLAHSETQCNAFARLGNLMRVNGIDAELLDRSEVQQLVPPLDCRADVRFPVHGALRQARAGTARHDAVAWGYARAADALGVDIVQNCEVQGLRIDRGRIRGVETSRGPIRADTVGLAVAGHTSRLAAMAGLRLPIESHLLQAMVTEPVKPVLDTVVMSGAVHVYVSQTDKGEILMGSDLDLYPSYSTRGNLPRIESIARETLALFPSFGRLRLLRTWGGITDMSMDGSPIIGPTPVEGLYVNGGWCYGGFKATPASGLTFAWTLAHGEPHELVAAFALERFERGATIDESGRGPLPQLL